MKRKYTIQYRSNGAWQNGNTFDTKQAAINYAQQTGRDYQVISSKR